MDPRLVDQSYHISLCKEIFQNSQEDYEPDGVIFGPPALPTEVPKRLSHRLSTTADNHTGTRWTIGIGGGIRPDEEDEVSVYLVVGTATSTWLQATQTATQPIDRFSRTSPLANLYFNRPGSDI
ncbi:hypothetical protein BDR07DRAFT_1385725 [Suillus spraguei]|nr:hypothetical protein BDR07DRAFT_1385725 [Suillus spraguei]